MGKYKPSLTEDKQDLISNLPDEILLKILSNLPPKLAASTSLLSPRWRQLWTKVPSIHFDYSTTSQLDIWYPYTDIISRILDLRDPQTCIQKFSLDCMIKYGASKLCRWVSILIEHGVQELDFSIHADPRDWYSHIFELPPSLFTCKSLTMLKLKGGATRLSVPSFVYLPKLKILELRLMEYGRNIEAFFASLSSSCPVLEDLLIEDAYRILPKLYIRAPQTLKRMTYVGFQVINFDAQSLEYLGLRGVGGAPVLVKDVIPSSLTEARVDLVLHDYGHGTLPLLNALQRIRVLYLSLEASQDENDDFELGCHNLITFPNLTRLVLRINSCGWDLLSRFLRSSPNLKDLSLEIIGYHKSDETNWIEPQGVPECLHSNLKIFEFWEYQDTKEEEEFVRYMLKNGRSLEKVKLHQQYSDWEQYYQKLFVIPRAASACQLSILEN
ncbi:FBD domain [Dillenia turbinata]|uniref:FBD domain n=1 Tax=Dillenia turbinata TaxID=194707 RepID=A0AAN8VKV6_9MAGN